MAPEAGIGVTSPSMLGTVPILCVRPFYAAASFLCVKVYSVFQLLSLQQEDFGAKRGFSAPYKVVVPFHMVHVDLRSRHQNEYLITLLDAFTKFLRMKTVRSTAKKFVIVFLLELFSSYGVPTQLVCDQGTSFTSSKFKEFCRERGIRTSRAKWPEREVQSHDPQCSDGKHAL